MQHRTASSSPKTPAARWLSGPTARAKIVCTIGPASNSEEMIRDLMLRGMDVARLNFSHGTHEQHAVVIERLRKVAADLDRSICILQDLQGPKIRTGRLAIACPWRSRRARRVTITSSDVAGTTELISTTYQNLADDVKPGERILLSDGRIELVVQRSPRRRSGVRSAERRHAGREPGHQSSGHERQHSFADRERLRDLEFGLKQGVDLVAISFVRTATTWSGRRMPSPLSRSDVGPSSPSWRSRRPSTTSTASWKPPWA